MKYIRPVLIILCSLWALIVFNIHGANTYSIMVRPLSQEFGVSLGLITSLIPLSIYISFPFLLAAGIVYDWRGGRIVMITGSIIAALASFGLSRVNSFNQFMVLYCILSVGGALFGGIAPLVMLANWFVKLRGIIIGVVLAVASVVAAWAPSIIGLALNYFGWRMTYLFLAFLPLFIIPFACFLKRRPEDDNSSPDFNMSGDKATLIGRSSTLAVGRYRPSYDSHSLTAGFTSYQATSGKNKGTAMIAIVATLLFVVIILAYFAKSFVTTSIVVSMINAAFSISAANSATMAMLVAASVGILFFGVLSDFVHVRIMLAVSLLIFGIGVFLFNMSLTIHPSSLTAPLVLGFGQGGLVCLVTIVLADYFGRGILGSLRGFVGILIAGISLVASTYLRYIYDTSNSISSVLTVIGWAVLACALLSIFIRPPTYNKLPNI